MFSPKHAVFVGPGRLPQELRDVLLRREGQPQPDLNVQTPRLLAVFDSAADAERVASQVQRLRIGAMVVGPEQPPIDDAWFLASGFEEFGGTWRIASTSGDHRIIKPSDVVGLSIVDWRPEPGPVDRAVLVRVRDIDRPIYIRASAVEGPHGDQAPHDALRRLNQFIDACSLELAPDAKVRSRRLGPADLLGGLEGDVLPLALAMVDQLDLQPASLHGPIVAGGRRRSGEHDRAPEYTGLGAALAWTLWLSALGLFGVSGALMALGAWYVLGFGVITLALGVLVAALASQRLLWSRFISRSTWGPDGPVPVFPIHREEEGTSPRWLGVGLDLASIALCFVAQHAEGWSGRIAAGLKWALVPVLVLSLLAAWDERRRKAP